MPKNKGSGGKKKRRGKNEADEDDKRELRYKQEKGEEYALVLRRLGDSRFEAMCIDGTKRLCHIPGKMHKRVWVDADDIVLVGLRDYQDGKADVIHKYTSNEARRLKAFGQLPNKMHLNKGIHDDDDDDDDGAGDDDDMFEDLDIDKI